MTVLRGLVTRALAAAEVADARPAVAGYALAGADTPTDLRLLTRALADEGFAARDASGQRHDRRAARGHGPWLGRVADLRRGVNAAGLAPDGRAARLDALGHISGDWGGGTDVGWAGLAAAVRGHDRRGPRTELEHRVADHFGVRSPAALTRAMYVGRIAEKRVRELSPIVFGAATDGDIEARRIVDRLADELVAMATSMLRRLRLTRLDPDVVLGGGVFRATDEAFYARIRDGVTAVAPRARLVRPIAPPVAGAALIGLEAARRSSAAGDPAVSARVRAELRAWDVRAEG